MTTLHEIWEGISHRPRGWYWMVPQLRNGDLYQACSLLPAFVETHADGLPVYVVVDSDLRADIVRLYGEYVAEIIIHKGPSGTYGDWAAFFAETGLPRLGVDSPILISAFLNPETVRFSPETLWRMGITPMASYRHLLHLPGDAEPAPPAPDPELARRAGALADEHGVTSGSSVILFPYAQSLRVEAIAHFEHLAAELSAQGWKVFTSVSHREEPIAGTVPIFIPFPLLWDVAERAGWVVGVRSGVADMLSSARCRQTWVYPNLLNVRIWSLKALGLARNAYEFAFFFPVGTPEEFCTAVLSGRSADALAISHGVLADAVACDAGMQKEDVLSFAELQRAPERLADLLAQVRERLSLGRSLLMLRDLPPASHRRWDSLLNETFTGLAEVIGESVRLYACRDYMGLGFYEELDLAAFVAGYYGAARYWHAVFLVADAPLEHLLRFPMDERVCALEPVTPGVPAPFGQAFGAKSHEMHMIAEKPLMVGGFELIEGWATPEPWGVWTLGRRCTFRFTLPRAASGPIRLQLAAMAALSEGQPVIAFSVHVNGVFLREASVALGAAPPELDFVVPAEISVGARVFYVTFQFHGLISPEEQGAAPDTRLLGLGVHSATALEAW